MRLLKHGNKTRTQNISKYYVPYYQMFLIDINNVSNNMNKTITITFVELSLCAGHFKDII